jgi:hypothetical protein
MVTTKSLKLSAIALLLAAAFITAGVYEAAAVPALYGTFGKGEYSSSSLVEIDQTTGEIIRFIGQVGYTLNGLAWDPTTGRLYGSTSTKDPSYNGLIEIDMATGAGTAIGVDGWGFGGAAITNITVNSSGQMYGWTESGDDLVSINKSTGIATVIGNSGIGTWANGLAFDRYNNLYMVNGDGQYYLMNRSTGTGTLQGDISPGVEEPAHHGVFHPYTNLYYGLRNNPWPWDTSSTNLLSANLSTGSVLSMVPTAFDLHTLAFVDLPGVLELDLDYDNADNTLDIQFTVGTEVPAVLAVWLQVFHQQFLLGAYPLPAVDPRGTIYASIPLPNIRNVGILATLVTPGGGITYSAWKTVDTGN